MCATTSEIQIGTLDAARTNGSILLSKLKDHSMKIVLVKGTCAGISWLS
jgi:hypothetical protein